ncbi:MAG: glycosyltransferase family 87 protein [Planctomycetota bacterium]
MTGPARGAPLARLIRGGLLLLLVAVAVALVVPRSQWLGRSADGLSLLERPQARAESDFQLHWAAGRALARGEDPWDSATVNALGAVTGRPFTPFCAANPLVLRGFALADPVDWQGAYARWLTVNHVLLGLAVLVLALVLRRAGLGPAAALAVALAAIALNDGTWMGHAMNQLNGVTLLLVLLALLAAQAGRPVQEGVCLALAAAAKTSPALLIVLAVFAGRWRTVRSALATGAGLLVLSIAWNGWEVHRDYLALLGRELGYVASLPSGAFNNSLHDWNLAPNGLLSRAAEAGGWSRGGTLAAVWLVSLATLALTARWALAWKRRASANANAAALLSLYALGLSASFLISSVTWPTHLSLAALPVAWLVVASWSGRSHVALTLAAAIACATLFLPLGTLAAEDPHHQLDILIKADACLLLFAVLLALPRTPAAQRV